MIKKLILSLLLLLIACISANAQTSPEDFYSALNKTRKNRLRRELQIDTALAASAKAWIIKTKGKLWHDRSNNYGEVLALTNNPLEAWLNSKGHKKTILSRKYRFVGYAYVNGVACARFR